MLRPTVRLRILKGAIIIGPNRYEKGHSFVCDKEYAEQLIKDNPNSYEIIRQSKIKEAVSGNVIQPLDAQTTVQKFSDVAVSTDGDNARN